MIPSKKSETNEEQEFLHPGFEFFKDHADIKFGELKFQTDFEYSILHPCSISIIEIKSILEICTTYKGVSYGPALIKYKDPKDKSISFKGVGNFNKGKLHMTPFTCINEDGLLNE